MPCPDDEELDCPWLPEVVAVPRCPTWPPEFEPGPASLPRPFPLPEDVPLVWADVLAPEPAEDEELEDDEAGEGVETVATVASEVVASAGTVASVVGGLLTSLSLSGLVAVFVPW